MWFNKWMYIGGFLVVLTTACSKPQQFSQIVSNPVTGQPGEVITDVPEQRPPALIWVQFPNGPVSTNEDTRIVYDIIPGSAPVVSVECKIDGVVVPCSIDGDTLIVNSPEEGSHKVEVVVTDENNLQDSGSVVWDAFNRFLKVKNPLQIVGEEDRVDILVVVDNSVSMKAKQANMANRVSNLLDRLSGLNWRIGIVTTDMVDKTLGDGRLLKYPNGRYYIDSSMSLSTARDQFGKTVQRAESGNYLEQGIKATFRAIERALNPKESVDQKNKDFFRKEAALAVIVISDEDESASALENTPAGLLGLVKATYGDDKIFKFHSIIVRPGDKTCLDSYPNVHTEGKAYAALTLATGGIIGDICASDYGNQLTVIGQDVANTQNTFDLSCNAMDIDGDGKVDIKVVAESGTPAPPSFVIDGNKIIFSRPPRKGKYNVEYFCPKP